jgi:Ca-activated chloride channel family protein
VVSFAEPSRLVLLALPVAALALVLYRHRVRLADQRRLASPAVWDRLMGGAPATGHLRLGLCLLAAALVILALARPQWGELPEELSLVTRDVVVALDVSDSMLCADVRPDRLRRGLEVIRRSLAGLDGNRVGVVVFAGDAYPLVPLTTDLQAVAAFLQAVEPGMVGRGGSNLEGAMGASLELLPEEGDGRVVVLVTDGENLQGDPEAAGEALSSAGASLVALVTGTEAGGPIPMVGPDGRLSYKKDREGRPVVTRADPSVVGAMVEATGGALVESDTMQPEDDLIEAVEAIRTREIDSLRQPRRIDRFPIPLALAALAALAAFALSPWRRRAVAVAVALACLAPIAAEAQQPASAPRAPAGPPPAVAGDGSGGPDVTQAPSPRIPWWERLLAGGSRRYARRGVEAWDEGDAQGATTAFAAARELDPDSGARAFDLGTALAAQGDLEGSTPLLEAAESEIPMSAYNAGTAALSAQQPDRAVAALRRAVVADPSDADARRNLELALKMLEEQEQDQQQDQDQEQEQDQQEDQDEQDEQDQQNQPTPTPNPQGGGDQDPTPTPTPNPAIFQALDRAEREARESMQSPTPVTAQVERDW